MPTTHSSLRNPYRGGQIGQYRPPYRPDHGAHARERHGDHRRRSGWYSGAYGYGNPGWGYPYPFVIDPGFYDWDSPGDSYDQGAANPGYAPYVQNDGEGAGWSGDAANAPQPYPASVAPGNEPTTRPASAALEEPLTLIFKDGRTPRKMQNYIMNAKALTDLDPQHFERIPLDQIDVAATEEFNRARGVDFELPVAGRE